MYNNQLQKAINIAKKTGDRIMLVDNLNEGDCFVIMRLEEYERIILGKNEIKDLTEDGLLDKINRDIVTWKKEEFEKENNENINKLENTEKFENLNNEDDDSEIEEENLYYYNEENKFSADQKDRLKNSDFFNYKEEGSKSTWKIPAERKAAAEEIK